MASLSLPNRERSEYSSSINFADIFDFSGDKVRSPRLHVRAYPNEKADTRRHDRARAIGTREENYRRRRVRVSIGLRKRGSRANGHGHVCRTQNTGNNDGTTPDNYSTPLLNGTGIISSYQRAETARRTVAYSVGGRRLLITWSRGRPQCCSPFVNFLVRTVPCPPQGERFLKTFTKLWHYVR